MPAKRSTNKHNGNGHRRAEIPQPTFPMRCGECRRREMRPHTITRTVQVNHDGRKYDIPVPKLRVLRCDNCGDILYTNETDQQISDALRDELVLLKPEQIANNLHALGMSQKDFAFCLGFAPETVSRWINGSVIQSRASDKAMRMFFGCPEARERLLGNSDPDFGIQVVMAEDHVHHMPN